MKHRIGISVLLISLLITLATSAFILPLPAEVPASASEIGPDFFANPIEAAGPQISTLLGLVAGNALLGIFVAIKNKKFEWAKLADFYRTDVIPKLGGYLAVRIIVGFGAVEFLGPQMGEIIGNGLLVTVWLAVVASLTGDILTKIAALGIKIVARVPGVSLE